MKEFDRWDQKEYPLPACYERGPVGREMLKQRRRAWRAALEWWGRREVFGKKAYYSGNIRFTDVDYRIELMKKELEEYYEDWGGPT